MKTIMFVDVGEGITEGHIKKWMVQDGDMVKEDQPVVQVETDKAVVNVPSPISGMLKINAPENATVYVGDTVAYIGQPSELQNLPKQPVGQAKQAEQPKKPAIAAQTQPQHAARLKEPSAAPSVRKMARDLGVDLAQIAGTGPGGRILENDVRNAAHGASLQSRPLPKLSESLEKEHEGEIVREPMSQTRKAIARNMELSWTIPRAVHMDMADATSLFNEVEKEKLNAASSGVKLTFLPFIIKAVVQALKENPHFNASYDHETQNIIVKKYYNIGLAAEAPDGLKVAVIKSADKKSKLDIAKEIQELHQKIKDQTISLDEMRDSTFTITNIGSLGGGYLSVPMINYPEIGILGLHMIKDAPVVDKGQIRVGKVLPISLSFDHRVVDGAEAVKFANAVIKYLEDQAFLEAPS